MSSEIEPRPAKEKSWENTIAFLQEASVVGIDHKALYPPRHGNHTRATYERNLALSGEFAGLPDKTVREIGETYKASADLVRGIFARALIRFHRNTTREIARKYPLDSLSISRPIPDRVQKPAEIVQNPQTSPALKADPRPPTNFERLRGLRDPNSTVIQKLMLLDTLEKSVWWAKKKRLAVSLESIAHEAGIHRRRSMPRMFNFLLENQVATVRYSFPIESKGKMYQLSNYVVAEADRVKALNLLSSSEELADLRESLLKSDSVEVVGNSRRKPRKNSKA